MFISYRGKNKLSVKFEKISGGITPSLKFC